MHFLENATEVHIEFCWQGKRDGHETGLSRWV
jgi:hypothetical protein